MCLACAEEAVSEEALRAAIQQSVEIEDADVDRLLEALYAYGEAGDRSHFETLWTSEDAALRIVSMTAYLVMLELEDLGTEAEALMRAYSGNEAGIVSGLIGHSPEGVDYLLRNYDTYTSDELSMLLEAFLESSAESQAEWLTLWESRREDYDALVSGLQDPVVRRNLSLKANFRALSDVTEDFSEELPAIEMIGDVLSSMDDARELAMSEERSVAVIQGDRHFFFSEYEQAVVSYRLALDENPEDVYALYLMGCALFELGKYHVASKSFDQVKALNAEIVSAEFMSRLSVRRSEYSDESLLTAAWLLVDQTNISERIGMMGANDPILQRLLGDQMLGKSGIYQISDSELLELAAAEVNNPRLQAGLVLMTSRECKERRLNELSMTYSENLQLQKAVLSFSQVAQQSDGDGLVLEILRNCREVDPKNRYLLDVEVAWLGDGIEPLAEDHFPDDWPEYKTDVAPISEQQLALIRKSSGLNLYMSVSGELRQCGRLAMQHLSTAFRILDESRYKGSDFYKFRDLFDQLQLSAELALEKKEFGFAEELLGYMDRVVADMLEAASSLIEQMAAQAFSGLTADLRAKSNRAQKILKQDDLDREGRFENSPFRKAIALYMKDAAFELIPLPSLRNTYAKLILDSEVYIEARSKALGEVEN
ncbi:MAG: hypothetical protein ACSHYA_18245 [Opitutaceae bacterium]